MKIKIFNREICVRALLDTNSLCAKSSAEMRYKNGEKKEGKTCGKCGADKRKSEKKLLTEADACVIVIKRDEMLGLFFML